jgi:hypothetical protein
MIIKELHDDWSAIANQENTPIGHHNAAAAGAPRLQSGGQPSMP